MFYSKAYVDFINRSKQQQLDLVLISVIETTGHCYAKIGNIMLVNSKGEFAGVLGSAALHEKFFEQAKSLFSSKQQITYENTPKDPSSGHGISLYSLESFLYKDDYELLEERVKGINKPYSVLIFGSGAHVHCFIELANTLGWKTTVIDMKIQERFVHHADACIQLEHLEDILTMDLSSFHAAVILSHSPRTDDTYLKALLNSAVDYIGIMGNKKNMNKKREAFALHEEARFFAPIGIDLGGITPESIALSICAQIEARKNGKI